MKFDTLVLIDDLFREPLAPAKQFFYDLIREPIRQATGADIRDCPRGNLASNLLAGFDPQTFLSLGRGQPPLPWNETYNLLTHAADEYLLRHIPRNPLLVSYEAPPWLVRFCASHHFALLDIRIAPLRFARDLCIAVNSQSALLVSRLGAWCLAENELKIEASLLQASVRHLRRYSPENRKYDGALIILGQTPADASLVGDDGKFLKAASFAEHWPSLCENRKIYYKSHPAAAADADSEKQALEKIIGRDIDYLCENIYTMLGADDDVAFAGISSGSLQEARFFGKQSRTLFRHICPLVYEQPDGYQLIAFADFVSPRFWKAVLSPSDSSPTPLGLAGSDANQLRQLHNVWWGYSEYFVKDRLLFREAFSRSGGDDLSNRIGRLESAAEVTRHDLVGVQREAESIRHDASFQNAELQSSLNEISRQMTLIDARLGALQNLLRPILAVCRTYSYVKRRFSALITPQKTPAD